MVILGATTKTKRQIIVDIMLHLYSLLSVLNGKRVLRYICETGDDKFYDLTKKLFMFGMFLFDGMTDHL